MKHVLENVNLAFVLFVCFSLAWRNVINIEEIRKYEIHAKIGSLEHLTASNDQK